MTRRIMLSIYVLAISVLFIPKGIAVNRENAERVVQHFRDTLDPSRVPVLPIETVGQILLDVREIFMSQPILLQVPTPTTVLSDLHGQYTDLRRWFKLIGQITDTSQMNYLFLGDYVDRGRFGLETILWLFALKILYPQKIFLLRGNHESSEINRIYGFYAEVKRKYPTEGSRLFKIFGDVFNTMPVSAVIEERIFLTHGGISPELMRKGSLIAVSTIQRPCDIPDSGLLCDLLWSDPAETGAGFVANSRGVSFEFGRDALEAFLDQHDFEIVVRGHQVQDAGYGFLFDRKLVTIFSAPNYCGEFDNTGSAMTIDSNLMCRFIVLKPRKTLIASPRNGGGVTVVAVTNQGTTDTGGGAASSGRLTRTVSNNNVDELDDGSDQ